MPNPIFQLPPVTSQDWLILTVLGLTAFSALVVFLLPRAPTRRINYLQLRETLGLRAFPLSIIVATTLLWGALAVFLVGGVLWTLANILVTLPKAAQHAEALRGLFGSLTAMGATLAAIIAAPFTLIRIRQTQKANDLTDERLFNDKLNEASKNLAAWRDVTTVIGTGDDRKVITTREPDLITRAAAIDRLYGLVEERPSEANRIAGLLSLYVREHTVKVGDKEPDVPPEEPPEGATPEELQQWAQNLRQKRSDLHHAANALGRIRNIAGVNHFDAVINLASANLQGIELRNLNFEHSLFGLAQLQGARIVDLNFQSADFFKTNLSGAFVVHTDIKKAEMFHPNLSGVSFIGVDARGARFVGATIDHLTELIAVDLVGACFRGTNLANLRSLTDYSGVIFGDGTNTVSPWPEHWPREELSYTDFIRAWRKWVAENHPDVLQYLPEDPLV